MPAIYEAANTRFASLMARYAALYFRRTHPRPLPLSRNVDLQVGGIMRECASDFLRPKDPE